MAANQATLRILSILVAALLCSPRLSVVAAGEAAGGGAHIRLEGKFRQVLTPSEQWGNRKK